jgi:hypothetical protein
VTNEDLREIGTALATETRRFVASLRDQLEPRLRALEDRPESKDGRDGIDGQKGDIGPAGAPGEPGKDGAPGRDGVDGKDGRDGIDGKSVSIEDIRSAIEVEVSRALLDLERRAADMVQRLVDRLPPPAPGKDGKDGRDGFGFDDVKVDHDGERGITVSFVQGDRTKSFGPFIVPVQIHRGTWNAEKRYEYQDTVTWAGSQWVCLHPKASSKPGDPNSGWQLSVKKGDIGREGKPGQMGQRGPKGDKGDPGPERW